jgi:hypothetical protein
MSLFATLNVIITLFKMLTFKEKTKNETEENNNGVCKAHMW